MTVTIAVEPIGDIDGLEREWTALESQSDCTYYYSWGWVGTWVRHVADRVDLVKITARDEGEIVGLVLAGESGRKLGAWGKRALLLQGTRGRLGRISSERGGFLIRCDAEEVVRPAFLRFLGAGVANGRWDRAVVGWVPPTYLEDPGAEGAVHVVRWREANHVVELDRVREAGDYTALLGPRTRKNMRRSRRSYERQGPLHLRVAATVDEAQAFLDRLIVLHESTWKTRGWPGNFADPAVLAFHRDLMRCRFDSGEVQLARIAAGRDEVGYLYNLAYRDRVISYNMGLHYQGDATLQPGRMCDWLVIEHYAAQGYAVYDNATGDTQFKRSLGTRRDELVWLLVRRDRLFDRIEERARRAFITVVRDTALHRWQRRLRVATASKMDDLYRVRRRGRGRPNTGPGSR